jgi:glucose-1-phosphate adenylyltransferase
MPLSSPRPHRLPQTYALVLAGGRGSRLQGLTERCAKPAVPFAGHHRIIDFVLANCLHSGVRRVGVLTQYRSQALIRHLAQAWAGAFGGTWGADGLGQTGLDGLAGGLDVVPAQQQCGEGWYAGTADAVRQNLDLLREAAPTHVLVLGGDHVYRMDYRILLEEHLCAGASVTVAGLEVPLEEAVALGVMTVDDRGRVCSFDEKPARPVPLPGQPRRALASMGLYLFDTPVLIDAIERDAADAASSHDFGRDVIPQLVARGGVRAHRFERSAVGPEGSPSYWRDVGTVDAYWAAHMDLLGVAPRLPLDDPRGPLPGAGGRLAPARIEGAAVEVRDSLLCDGTVVGAARLVRTVVGPGVRVGDGGQWEESVLLPGVQAGRDTTLRRCVVEQGCRLPDGFRAGLDVAHDRQRGLHVTAGGVTLIGAQALARLAPEAMLRDAAAPVPVASPVLAGLSQEIAAI